MRYLKKARLAPFFFGGLISVFVVLMLSPSKEGWVVRALILMLPICLVTYLRSRKPLPKLSKHYIALTVIWIFYIALSEYLSDRSLNYHMIKYGVIGLVIFFVVEVMLQRSNVSNQYLIISLLVLPALIHLTYMWFDITQYIVHSNISDFSPSALKDVPRVGRRYLSNALVAGVVGAALLSLTNQSHKVLWRFFSITFLFSLLVLDARSAYLSMLIAAVTVVLIFKNTIIVIVNRAVIKYWPVVIMTITLIVFVGYAAGSDRWKNFSRSVNYAWQDTVNKSELYPPYINKTFWIDVEDVEKCMIERQKRCWVDQSAYLRIAWTIEGVLALVNKPLGVGGGDNYMGRYWGVEGDANKWQRVDSGMTEYLVTFGLMAVFYFAGLFVLFLRGFSTSKKLSNCGIAFGVLIIILISRMLFDLVTEGLWLYFSMLLAVHFHQFEKE